MAKTATCAGDDDSLAGRELCCFDGLPLELKRVSRDTWDYRLRTRGTYDCDTSAQDGRSSLQAETIGDGTDVISEADAVLLESAIHAEARALGLLAAGLVALAAELARSARVCEPLDADARADLEVGGGVVADGDDVAGAFVPAHAGELGGERPVTLHDMEIWGNESWSCRQLMINRLSHLGECLVPVWQTPL